MRLLRFILLLVLSVNVSLGYVYDADLNTSNHQVIDLELQNQHYDATSHLCNSGNECLHSYLLKKTQDGSFFTSIGFSNATKGGVQANRAQGKAGEALTEAALRKDGSFAGKQVTFETSTGKRSVIDFVTNFKGGKGVVETKTGNARLTSGQRQLFDDVQNGRPAIPRGQNAANAGLTPGRPTVLKSCGIDRPC